MNINFFDSINHIAKVDWQKLNTSSCPLISYEIFQAFEQSNSVDDSRGWQPYHLTLSCDDNVTAIMPSYLKQHSWGEYVFDWTWAEAYQRNNIPYYPKLVASIPFTPVTTDKCFSDAFSYQDVFDLLIEHSLKQEINSWHILFCPEIKSLPEDVYQRNTVQFHWFNKGYQNFDHFLASFTARKRKNTLKERLSITQQGLHIRRIKGGDISEDELNFFYLTYQLTYVKKGHQPHLSFEFFQQIVTNLAGNILLIIASHQHKKVACAWFFYDKEKLYGRYWGCIEFFNNLHFELCYYQGIEFCIEQNIQCFNPGTQGEHKIQRGFEPVLTYSYHWIKHQGFKAAIKDFCQQERRQMHIYRQQCQQALPFKKSHF